jgi:tripartite-type tricarboxylate transporter receptor subunit TctC
LPGLDESATWIGLLAPARTPPDVVETIQREVARIYADPAFQEKLTKAGIFGVTSTAAEFSAYIRAETERWSKVIRDNPAVRLD